MVEERDEQVPKGYTRRDGDGYTRTDVNPDVSQQSPYGGTMHAEETPAIEVWNQKGWGLTVKKDWTDKDFMESHDPIYFAVYLNAPKDGLDENDTLVPETVRQLASTESEIYYFFPDLRAGTESYTYTFDQFVVREVTISGDFEVNADTGMVTVSDGGIITPISEAGTFITGAKSVNGNHKTHEYTVTYTVGETTGRNENIRTDTVTNSRPGIKLVKTLWDGETPLGGASFTLTDQSGHKVALDSYTSRASDGLITIAYLEEGESYILTETHTPEGYISLDHPMEITALPNLSLTIGGCDIRFYTYDPAGSMPCITIKNRPAELKVKKIQSGTTSALAGVHFALYRQVTDNSGNKVRDYLPMKGYEDMVTDIDGLLPEVNMQDLAVGTYYLHETKTLDGYALLEEDLCFTIESDGRITIHNDDYKNWLREDEDIYSGTYKVTITIAVPNGTTQNVSIWKTDSEHFTISTGASFKLYRAQDYDDKTGEPRSDASPVTTGKTGENGILNLGPLPVGDYRLVETAAPHGYIPSTSALKITVTETGVSATQSSQPAEVTQKGDRYWVDRQEDHTWQIRVWNNPGVKLPATGGSGTDLLYLLGTILTLLATLALIHKKQQVN